MWSDVRLKSINLLCRAVTDDTKLILKFETWRLSKRKDRFLPKELKTAMQKLPVSESRTYLIRCWDPSCFTDLSPKYSVRSQSNLHSWVVDDHMRSFKPLERAATKISSVLVGSKDRLAVVSSFSEVELLRRTLGK